MLKTDTSHIVIEEEPPPGALGRVVAMQSEYYAHNWGFGLPFESKVSAEVGDFGLALPDPDCRMWVARDAIGVAGTITIDGRGRPDARLRWFFVEERARGGLGRRLLGNGLRFCRERGFASVWLTTFDGLRAARGLYDQAGFQLEHEALDTTWGVRVREQVFRLVF